MVCSPGCRCPHFQVNMMLILRKFSLFMFDTIQATGGILNVLWAHDGQVRTGFYCWAQGTIKQIGATGTALITLVCPFPCCHCLQVLNLLVTVYTMPDTCCPHVHRSSVGERNQSTWRRFRPCWPHLCIHCALGWHQQPDPQ